ncbi:unnamed protein product [Didymodactylos carnosus]|uniref:Translin-associated factor X-interacting protein 1 N-terminal domain-containing protein n=1 Tax=Didymodactylos carnosus TaxID=1234261 RepID=A0A814RU45_9BILA|nr:unnamed protein product [Didymodactylos carnosus]CAF1161810.1 unnamed protein product [Didymodactylos carnosus]CAF3901151.1 unnamed protein product [Didymodactylos carnosus]CAF3973473.1 unnamed protein product [Didymodactylos carnosus]
MSRIKNICNTVYQDQLQSIHDLTSGHLNENHLNRLPKDDKNVRKTWESAKKPHPTLRPSHRVTKENVTENAVNDMKQTLINFTTRNSLLSPRHSLTLPGLPIKKPKTDRPTSAESITDQPLPKLLQKKEKLSIPAFSIDISDENRLKKLKNFDANIVHKKDIGLHGFGYSEDFVNSVEQNLNMKVNVFDSQFQRQTLSLTRLQAYGDAMNQLVNGSSAFGPVLARIKSEYELYLDHLLTTQPEFGSHIAEQLKRLRTIRSPRRQYSPDPFDIEGCEERVKDALKKNEHLRIQVEELRQKQQEQRQLSATTTTRTDITKQTGELHIKTPAERVDELREHIFHVIDEMKDIRQELETKFVPSSVCSRIQQCIRDTEVDITKASKQNKTLTDEVVQFEEKIRSEILKNDTSEFGEEHVKEILMLLKKVDVLHAKHVMSNHLDDDNYFLHTYDDYFS